MLRLLVTTVLFVSVTCCNHVLKPGSWGLGHVECHLALAPTYTEQQLHNTAVTTCIAEQPGLQAIIDRLSFPFKGGHGSKHLFGLMSKDIATLLETNGRPTEATTLRECTARAMGMVNGNATYDMEALKADILTKVTGLPILTNVQLGLAGCPVVEAFDVTKYMLCITTYCKTGAAP